MTHLLNKKTLDNDRHVSQQKVQCEHCDKQVDKANCKCKKDNL